MGFAMLLINGDVPIQPKSCVIHVLRVLSVVNERSLLFVVSSSKYFLLERKGRHLLPPVVSCFKAEGRCTVCVCSFKRT